MNGVITVEYQDVLGPYECWFDGKVPNWTPPPYKEYNWIFLRVQQNWANDLLKARGHVFLNEIFDMLGFVRNRLGAVVGWVYDGSNTTIDFGCWDKENEPIDPDTGILLRFNIQGEIISKLDHSL